MTKCRICNRASIEIVDLSGFVIKQCKHCHYAQVEPYPKDTAAQAIYQQGYFDEKTSGDHLSDSRRKYSFVKEKLRSFGMAGSDARLLDFGCGTGNFLKCASRDLDAQGYDISKFAADYVREELRLLAKSESLTQDLYSRRYFDCVTSFDVIEHLTHFEDAVKCFNLWLNPGGLLFMTTPNIDVWDRKLFGKKWYGFTKYPEHINFFSPKSMEILLRKHGFEVVTIKIWGFTRSVGFICDHGLKHKSLNKIVSMLVRLVGLHHVKLYLPMVDMMVVARKIP